MESRVEALLGGLERVEKELACLDISAHPKEYRDLSREHARLVEIANCWKRYQALLQEEEEGQNLLKADEELEEEFIEEIGHYLRGLEEKREWLFHRLEGLLVPPDPADHANTIMELRAGTGGEEAALFVADCVRMYRLYADKMGWKAETLSCTPSNVGGYKEYILSLRGSNVYRLLRYEAGTHRVQRVPATEAQGRVHTSAITVAILKEPEEKECTLDEKELKVDTYRSSGAGGQHVNTTDSAVRITHLPTGIVVCCQQERSQHKNKQQAMRVLLARLTEEQERRNREQVTATRGAQVGSGDRSERIRTYNIPQNRLTDHRIKFTSYRLNEILEGDLEKLSQSLVRGLSNPV